MNNNTIFFIELLAAFLPFALFVVLNNKANVKKEIRCKQYIMPIVAVVYSIALLIAFEALSAYLMEQFLALAGLFETLKLVSFAGSIRKLHETWGVYLSLVLFNTCALMMFVLFKRSLMLVFSKLSINRNTLIGDVVELFYNHDVQTGRWYIKQHYGQARTFIKTVYYSSAAISAVTVFVSCILCMKHLIATPFSPVFTVIILGEMAFFIDGFREDEGKLKLNVHADNSRHVAIYPLLRKPLRDLFEDKLAADGTTINGSGINSGAVEDVLAGLEATGGHIGKNYAAFIRKKMDSGLKPNVDYLRSGYELATGKSLLFNTPFYDKLNPYVFYAMNRSLLAGGKVLIVLGRHGTEEDLHQWCENGMQGVSNIPGLWKIGVLSGQKQHEDDLPDIGIISRSAVHDLDLHKSNLPFLKQVSFVFVVEPSRFVTTAQIGLNLLIKCCGKNQDITFCSIDRNCDGLVDALSHILMTNITEVSATEYPHGMSSYMYWTADADHLQHRILPGVSRYLGMGTELSVVALKNQVKKTVWYGGDAFPVQDARWIAKQYYHDFLDFAHLPPNQETFDKCFQTSFNMCNERVSDYAFVTVEDERNNLFETRRNFATIAEQQGFVNVISTDYMLRDYMASNTELFTADAKAIPYITADYARTKRNSILSLCLLLCIDTVQEDHLHRQMVMMNLDASDPVAEIWNEICVIFNDCTQIHTDKKGTPVLVAKGIDGKNVRFEKDATILFKRAYSIETGRFENVYTIENADFARIILNDLQNASYIAEQDSKDFYIGTELKGHIHQKYLPGQFFTLNGKYYEMVSTTADNRILLRRAADHINGRLAYRQIRNYTIHHMEDSNAMGALKTVNDIDIHYQYADFSVDTPGYWKLSAYNDFDNGDLVMVNGVPTREYHHKQVLKFDFTRLGDAFTDSIRITLTNLLNEVFVTLFAENQPFISAVTPGSFDAPLTYSMTFADGSAPSDKCIYIIEDSQLDIGLLVAVERNVNRIFQIISDYLSWNNEQISESMTQENTAPVKKRVTIDLYEGIESEKKAGILGKLSDWLNSHRSKGKDRTHEAVAAEEVAPAEEESVQECTSVAEVLAADESSADTESTGTENLDSAETVESAQDQEVAETEEIPPETDSKAEVNEDA